MTRRLARILSGGALVAACGLTALGCSDSDDGGPVRPPGPGGTAPSPISPVPVPDQDPGVNAAVELTGSPPSVGPLREARVATPITSARARIERVLLSPTAAGETGFTVLTDEPQVVDLVGLRGGVTRPIFEGPVVPGEFRRLRLVLSDLEVDVRTPTGVRTLRPNQGIVFDGLPLPAPIDLPLPAPVQLQPTPGAVPRELGVDLDLASFTEVVGSPTSPTLIVRPIGRAFLPELSGAVVGRVVSLERPFGFDPDLPTTPTDTITDTDPIRGPFDPLVPEPDLVTADDPFLVPNPGPLGEPLVDVFVQAFDLDAGSGGAGIPAGSTVTDADGIYVLDGLLPGVYRLRFTHPTHRERQIPAVEVVAQRTTSLDVGLQRTGAGAADVP